MSTPEERAEAVNRFLIQVGELVGAAKACGLTSKGRVEMIVGVSLGDLEYLVEELREAKLARARLALKAAPR